MRPSRRTRAASMVRHGAAYLPNAPLCHEHHRPGVPSLQPDGRKDDRLPAGLIHPASTGYDYAWQDEPAPLRPGPPQSMPGRRTGRRIWPPLACCTPAHGLRRGPARRPPGDGGVPPRPPPFPPRLRAGRRRRLVPQNTPAPPLAPISQLAWPPGAMPHACRMPPRVGHAPRLPPPAGILKAQMRTRGPARRDTLIYTPRAGLVDGAAFPGDALISCQLTLYFFYHVP